MGIETLAAVSLASAAGSGIMGAMGASAQADSESAMYSYKAQVAKNNAIIAERNAVAATEAGGAQAQTNDLKTRAMGGAIRAAQSANGLDVNTGSNADVQQSAADVGHLDTLTILNNALKNATGFRTQGMNFENEAQLDTAAAANAKTAGQYKVATSLLGSAGSFSDKWLSYSQKGII